MTDEFARPDLDALLDRVNATLLGWERTRNEHHLTDAVVAEGRRILTEAKHGR